jgi:hypothetical protein
LKTAPIPKPRHLALLLAAWVSWLPPANAFLVQINAGTRTLFLQVGAGSFTGTFNNRGTPRDNATINSVTVTVPAAALGTGSLPMTSNSTVAASPYDGYAFCNPPGEVYVGGFYRIPGATGTASLTVTTTSLVNATADQIPFTDISWTSGGNGDTSATIPAGTFGGTAGQSLLSIAANRWFESCLTFRFRNATAYAAGTFNGRAIYTLTAP